MAELSSTVFDWLKETHNIIDKDKQSISREDLSGKVVGFYFSGHWCGPCRRFTPDLAAKYQELIAQGHPIEIIFVSADEDEDGALEYFKEMPWKMLSFEDRDAESKLSEKFEVQGIPSLALIDFDTGETITTSGREAIMTTSFDKLRTFEAEKKAAMERAAAELAIAKQNFSLGSFFATDSVVGKDGVVAQEYYAPTGDKVVGLYFSAHWCPPCRGFTPKLAEKYTELKSAGKNFEIIFISSDRDEQSANDYYAEMPWLMLSFADRDRKKTLSDIFEIKGIPTLVLIDKDGTITTDGRGSIMSEPFDELRESENKKKAEKEALDQLISTLPESVTSPLHNCVLSKLPKVYRGGYRCDVCGNGGNGYVYHCDTCGWDAHPGCIFTSTGTLKGTGEGAEE